MARLSLEIFLPLALLKLQRVDVTYLLMMPQPIYLLDINAQRSFINDSDIIPNIVFLNSAGHYWDESKVRVLYKNYLASIGVPYIKFHGLRHTFATRILESNVAPKVAQELLGHTNVSITTDIYSHVLPEVKREAMNKIKGIV